MIIIISLIVIGGLINGAIHESEGLLKSLDKLYGGFYSMASVILCVVAFLLYGKTAMFITLGAFLGSVLVFSLIFSIFYKLMKNMNKD